MARLSVKDIASCTGISEGSVQTILKKRLGLRKVCARWVHHLLNEEQKTQRQAKDAQESTFYMTTPPLISVRLLSDFWLLKR